MQRLFTSISQTIRSTITARIKQVRPQEWGLLSLSALFSFGAVALAIFIRTWADTLFLTHFEMSQLPIFFIWSAFAFAPVTMGYTWLSKRISPVRLNTATLLLFSGSCLLCLSPPSDRFTLFIVLLLMSLVSPLVNAICWGVILERISSLQSRRLIPLISSASTIGAVSAGVIAAEVIEWGGLTALMGVIILTLIILATLPGWLLRSSKKQAPAERSTARTASTRDRSSEATAAQPPRGRIQRLLHLIKQSRILYIVAISTLMMAITTNLIDYIFKSEVKRALSVDEIGPFLARFHAITNAGIFGVQIFILNKLTDRLGLKWSFPLSPISIISVTALCLSPLGWFAFVWLRGVDTLMKFTVHSNTENLVLTPVPLVLRTQAKVLLKGAIYPLGGLIAGVLVWLMSRLAERSDFDPVTGALIIVVTLCFIWLFTTLKVHLSYWEQLAQNLKLPAGPAQRAPKVSDLKLIVDMLVDQDDSLPTRVGPKRDQKQDEVTLINLIISAFELEDHREEVFKVWESGEKRRSDLIAWIALSARWRGVKGLGALLERYMLSHTT